MRTSGINKMEQGTCQINIGGKTMTWAEYKKMTAKEKEGTRPKREKTLIQELPPYIAQLRKNIKVLKSLKAYKRNGYKQWGTIANEIIDHPMISGSFASFSLRVEEVDKEIERIRLVGKGNEKSIFQLIEILANKFDDTRTALQALCHDIHESRVCEHYKSREAINGIGKRLGLQELAFRSLNAIDDMAKVVTELKRLSQLGVSEFDYAISQHKARIKRIVTR